MSLPTSKQQRITLNKARHFLNHVEFLTVTRLSKPLLQQFGLASAKRKKNNNYRFFFKQESYQNTTLTNKCCLFRPVKFLIKTGVLSSKRLLKLILDQFGIIQNLSSQTSNWYISRFFLYTSINITHYFCQSENSIRK